MIPPYPRKGANSSERALFTAFEGALDRPDWVVIHSLSIGQNLAGVMGETDFLVIAPGAGMVVIEAKAPAQVEYRAGEWYLDRTPSPRKDPLKQLDGARRSIRGFLRDRDLLHDDEPIARMVWFTSLGRHQFDNHSPGDMQFFEWELGWHDDIAQPVAAVEKVLREHNAWFSEVGEVDLDPAAFIKDHADAIAAALLADFTVGQTKSDLRRERHGHEVRLLTEQRFALDLVERNDHVYFDGPAGTGKSYLVTEAARRAAAAGKRVLVTCWNVLMADELRLMAGGQGDLEVADLNSLMLSICRLPANPPDAAADWYDQELPTLALAKLSESPHLGGFETICVDEFQDIAGNLLLLEVLFALAGTGKPAGTQLVFAGDDAQRILGGSHRRASGFATARALVPDLVHVGLQRNCRTVPAIVGAAEALVGRPFGFRDHRISRSAPGGLSRVAVSSGAEVTALVKALRGLLEHHEADDIVILSPYGEKNSTVGEFLRRTEGSPDERWLRKQLTAPGSGRVRWRSIFKFKGLDAEAVILTDLGSAAQEFVATTGTEWSDLLYVGLTRGRYRCVVLEPAVAE